MRLGRMGLMAAAVVGLLGAANAAKAVTLADLIASNGTVVSGDKIFSNFNYTSTANSSMPSAAGVTVTATSLNGNVGILFTGNFSAINGEHDDASIFYTVTIAPAFQSTFKITDIHLDTDIQSVGVNGGTSTGTITETITGSVPPGAAGQFAQNFNIVGNTNRQISSPPFTLPGSGYTSLTIEKDIALSAAVGNTETVSIISQTFSQTSSVPVPAAAWMGMSTLAGMGGLGVLRRRSRKA
jgi:hypothetical protein